MWDWLLTKVRHLCGPWDPGGSGMTRLRIKDWDGRLQKGGRLGGGRGSCGWIGNWAQSPAQHATLQASSSPASKSPEISPEPLRQIIVINNKSPPLISPASPPRGKTSGPASRCPGDWTLTSPPSRSPSVSNFVCLFVYSKTPETAAAGRVISTELAKLKGVGKNKASNYMWFSPSWGIMGMAYLIGRDKLDCEWALMTGRPTGKLGVLFFNCLLTVKTKKKKKSRREDSGNVLFPPRFHGWSGGPPSCRARCGAQRGTRQVHEVSHQTTGRYLPRALSGNHQRFLSALTVCPQEPINVLRSVWGIKSMHVPFVPSRPFHHFPSLGTS